MADVTYCPKSHFPSGKAPPSGFPATAPIGIVWHSDCSSYLQAAEQRPHQIRTRRAKTLLHKQASKRPMSPAPAGLLFFNSSSTPSIQPPAPKHRLEELMKYPALLVLPLLTLVVAAHSQTSWAA